VVVGKVENDLVRDTLLVTACKHCNWGRRDALERWDEMVELLVNRGLAGRRDAAEIRGYAEQIYFRARLALQRRAG